MEKVVVRMDWHFCDYSRITVKVDWMPELVQREATALERADCPPRFTCYACGEHRSKSELAGEVLAQRLCRSCSPYVSERDVGYWIRWDARRGFRNYIREY